MRKKIVAGNWKMNKTPSEAEALAEMLLPFSVVGVAVWAARWWNERKKNIAEK